MIIGFLNHKTVTHYNGKLDYDFRAELGAVINRLDNAISNLTNVTVHTEMSLSQIRDTDYAQEMSRMTTTQIIEKATMAMMSQSNASKQDVLQLLN